MMDRRHIDEHDVIRRYLDRHLSDEELEAFETAMIADPELAQRVELETLLRAGLRRLENEDQAAPAAAKWWPIAAGVAAVSLAGSLMTNYYLANRLEEQSAAVAAQANVPLLSLAQVRGGMQTLSVPADARLAVVNVQLAYADADSYRVRIGALKDDRLIVEFEDVRAMGAGDLVLLLPRELLEPGDYEAQISDAAGNVEAFPFRIVVDD